MLLLNFQVAQGETVPSTKKGQATFPRLMEIPVVPFLLACRYLMVFWHRTCFEVTIAKSGCYSVSPIFC